MSSVVLTVLLGVIALAINIVNASPSLIARESITALTTSQIDAFTPYTYYASAGYCTSTQTLAWDCGSSCGANPDFKPVTSGGNGNSVQYWFVGYDPNLSTVIVSHQGTNTSEILPILTDANFFLTTLDPTLFPGISPNIEVHNGFKDAQAATATAVLSAVKTTMSTYNTTSVTTVGHSLGGAIALLDSVYLPLWLPTGTTFQTICYGLPRVGNQNFANYIDANDHLTHINNQEDPIPTLPSLTLGYVASAGEVHIEDSGEWAACPGQDNPSIQCTDGDVPQLSDGNLNDHLGPYNGVEMVCS